MLMSHLLQTYVLIKVKQWTHCTIKRHVLSTLKPLHLLAAGCAKLAK